MLGSPKSGFIWQLFWAALLLAVELLREPIRGQVKTINAVLVFKKTVLDRIPRYKRTALKEECLYVNIRPYEFGRTHGMELCMRNLWNLWNLTTVLCCKANLLVLQWKLQRMIIYLQWWQLCILFIQSAKCYFDCVIIP